MTYGAIPLSEILKEIELLSADSDANALILIPQAQRMIEHTRSTIDTIGFRQIV